MAFGREPELEDVYKLVKENNRMLHAMRRNAFLSGVFRILVWIALIIIPYWLYVTYLAPVVDSMMQTMQQVQGTSAQAQAQFDDLNAALQNLKNQIPGFLGGGQ